MSAVQYTDDLSIFQRRPNRRTDQDRAASIAKNIAAGSNLLHAYPIVVDEHLGVLDGDHRLAAARIAAVGIYYLVVPGMTVADQAHANALTKSWTMPDWATFYASRDDCVNRGEYQWLLDLYAEYPGAGFASLLDFCRFGAWNRGTLRDDFKAGRFTVSDRKAARKLARMVADFRTYGLPGDKALAGATVHLFTNPEYEHKHLLRQMDRWPNEVKPQKNSGMYLAAWESLYNWRRRNRVILRVA